MKRTTQTLLLLILAFVGIVSCISNAETGESKQVVVKLKYDAKTIRSNIVNWQKGMTALEALQYAENVETHPVGEYVFVCKIDTAANIRGVKAWYYKINGVSPGKLAIWQPVSAGDTITWIYKQDVCSGTVNEGK